MMHSSVCHMNMYVWFMMLCTVVSCISAIGNYWNFMFKYYTILIHYKNSIKRAEVYGYLNCT